MKPASLPFASGQALLGGIIGDRPRCGTCDMRAAADKDAMSYVRSGCEQPLDPFPAPQVQLRISNAIKSVRNHHSTLQKSSRGTFP